MKNLLIGFGLLTSLSSFASADFLTAQYNLNSECEISVETKSDSLKIELGVNEITRFGAILSGSVENASSQLAKEGFVELDNATGGGFSYTSAKIFFKNGLVTSFEVNKRSPRGLILGETFKCNIEK